MKLSCDSEVYSVSEVSPDSEAANLTSLLRNKNFTKQSGIENTLSTIFSSPKIEGETKIETFLSLPFAYANLLNIQEVHQERFCEYE